MTSRVSRQNTLFCGQVDPEGAVTGKPHLAFSNREQVIKSLMVDPTHDDLLRTLEVVLHLENVDNPERVVTTAFLHRIGQVRTTCEASIRIQAMYKACLPG